MAQTFRKDLDIGKVVKRYNNIMEFMCLEYLTIGTRYSEDTEGWNLRDMVSEAQYQLDLHYDEDTLTGQERYSECDGGRQWRKEVGRLA